MAKCCSAGPTWRASRSAARARERSLRHRSAIAPRRVLAKAGRCSGVRASQCTGHHRTSLRFSASEPLYHS
eukprot:12140201-Alexandrium_andersonii.AAC.1